MGRGLQFSSNYIHGDVSSTRGGFADTSRGATFRKTCSDATVGLSIHIVRYYNEYSRCMDTSLLPCSLLAQASLGTAGLATLLSATVQLCVRHTEPACCVGGCAMWHPPCDLCMV